MAEKMIGMSRPLFAYWTRGCFFFAGVMLLGAFIGRESLRNHCLGLKAIEINQGFVNLSKQNRRLDFEFIAGCYFASFGKELCWDLRHGLDLCFFYDENFVYVIPISIGATGFEAKKYGAMIDRETGMVYNRVSRKWEAVGYTTKTLEDVKKNLAGKDLREILAEMGKPVEIRFLTNGQLLLDYQTSGGCFWIYLEKGVFLKV